MTFLAATDPASAPAAGAELTQVLIATTGAGVLTVALLVLGLGHRSGRLGALRGLGQLASRIGGLPGWAALPSAVATISLIGAVFGMYWDVSLHIDNGRDPGPLANPSHYFILAGLFGIFAAGWLAIVLPEGRPSPTALRIRGDWYAPVGGVLLMACASFALLGFPLDDVSHRLFGQDVTLWGPTHLMMLGGAAMSLIGILVLLVEARLAGEAGGSAANGAAPGGAGPLSPERLRAIRLVSACGGLLVGLSIFQGEFDFGVPQFRLLFHPVLIALAAATALVAARVLAGRGAALAAAVFFIVLRGGLAIAVGGVFEQTTPHFPLYLVEAVLVEAVALRLSTERPYRFALVASALVGTVGVVAEWVWSQVWMPLPWPSHMLPQAIAFALPVALAGGVLGAFAAGALRLRPDVAGTRRGWAAAGASLLVVGATLGYLLATSAPPGLRASVTLTEARPAPAREVHATVRLIPADAGEQADWLTTIGWQGGDDLRVAPLRRVGEGVYRTTEPLPVHGTWKSGVRLAKGDTMALLPVFLPPDPAIPAAGVPALPRFERPLRPDREVLQRERKQDVPAWLWGASGAVVLGISLTLLLVLGWGLARVARAPRTRAAQVSAQPAAERVRATA